MLQVLLNATFDIVRMVFIATIFTLLLGLPLGCFLEALQNDNILKINKKNIWLHKILLSIVKFFTYVPTLLILIILIPIINKLLFEHFTIELSAIISLIIINTFIFAGDVFYSLNSLPKELSDTAKFLGAEPIQFITKFLLPEITEKLIKDITKLIINLIGLSIICSILGVSVLGKLALEKRYNDSELSTILYIIVLFSFTIYIIKLISKYLINYIQTNNE